MTKLLRDLSFVVLLGVVLLPPQPAAAMSVSCDYEEFACSRKQWDFWDCANTCAAILVECISNCGGEAPEEWECVPPGTYAPPGEKKDGWCYCYTGPCSG
jgi:hypothetical protein